MKAKLVMIFMCLGTLYSQAQSTKQKTNSVVIGDSVTMTDVTLEVGDKTTNNYYGLDSNTRSKIDSLYIKTNQIQSEMTSYNALMKNDVRYADSVLRLNAEMSKVIKDLQYYRNLSDSLKKKTVMVAPPQEKVQEECAVNKTGDFCFKNTTGETLRVYLNVGFDPNESSHNYATGMYRTVIISSGDKQCYYDLIAKSYKYVLTPGDRDYLIGTEPIGYIRVVQCQEGEYIIKH